jgi:hypothetical protein
MERRYNNGDFEKLLRDNANQYRMYPSEKVWKGIHSALHTRRRWYGLTAAIMFLVTGSLISLFIFNNDATAKDNISESKIGVDKNDLQTTSTAPNADAVKLFTPGAPGVKVSRAAINKTMPGNLYFNKLSFNSPTHLTNGEPDAIIFNNSPAILNPEQIVEMSGAEQESIINPEHLSFEFPLSNNDRTSAEKEESLIENGMDERNIDFQSTVDPTTEQTIQNTISALASQKVSLAQPKKQARVTAQIYFAPTVSYRKLTENKKVYNSNSVYVPVIDLNNLVKHKPAMGLEFGIEGRYRVAKNFSIKSGFQFNINRYDIRAYFHPEEIATVALNSGYGVDTAKTTTTYRNFNPSTSPNWLENFYFQASIPVGVELILRDKKNFRWGVSATVQPTYTIGDRAYVISSDYKNYAKFPDLMRRWNVSTGIGTFVSYSTGRIRWQVGPHLRSQHLSSFVSALTVKEKLYSIGLKVGATLDNSYKK